ncbi:MAG: putative flagellin protein [Pseudomonadota bacterium]
MGLRVATNMASVSANRVLNKTNDAQNKSFQRLSSGQRITTAGDDAAGLSISENLRAQIRSTTEAEKNANNGVSLVQVAEGGLSEIGNILVRLRELSIQAASDTIGDKERGFINQEFQSLSAEVDRIANVTTFNGTQLLNGQGKDTLDLQVGTRNDEADRIGFRVSENDVRADSLGIAGLSAESIGDARASIDVVDQALSKVSETRARMGAMQNKLQSTTNNLAITKENLIGARSRIADTDVAEETSSLVRENILQQAGIAVLAQANQNPMTALKLL